MRKLQIAVVEDHREDRKWLEEQLDRYLKERKLMSRNFFYSTGEEFLQALKTEWFDIVFMDIYLDRITGVEAAQSLRNKDPDCKLIFFTCSSDFMPQGFSLNSAHYLVKPVAEEDFIQAMNNCRIKRPCEVPYLPITYQRTLLQIDTLDILYIDIHDRIVRIHTKQGILTTTTSFAMTVASLKKDRRFLLCNRALLINMDYISSMEARDFLMVTGERLPFTLRKKKSLWDQYHQYIFHSMENL